MEEYSGLTTEAVGNIRNRSRNGEAIFSVNSIEELTQIIIPHFDKYPLLTKKREDYLLFKQAVAIIKNKQHLTLEGLTQIISIRSSMNKGLSETLSVNFPDIIPAIRPCVEPMSIINPNWLAGFTEAEGCFYISINKAKTTTGYAVQLKFQLTQHSRDKQLMENIATYLGCGRYEARSKNIKAGNLVVSKISDLTEKIIPFYDKYSIMGCKSQDFSDFKRVSELVLKKAHLTAEGLNLIKKIKSEMN